MNFEQIAADAPQTLLGAIALYKVMRIEPYVFAIAAKMKVKPERRRIGAPFLIVLCMLGFACTTSRQRASEEIRSTNGTVTIRSVEARATVLGDGEQALSRLKLSAGKTLSVGMDGVDQSASSSNTVEGLKELNRLFGR